MGGLERQDAGDFAFGLVSHVADVEGEDRAQACLVEVVEEVFILEPGVRETVAGRVLDGLKERLRRDDTDFGHACANAVVFVENEWNQGR